MLGYENKQSANKTEGSRIFVPSNTKLFPLLKKAALTPFHNINSSLLRKPHIFLKYDLGKIRAVLIQPIGEPTDEWPINQGTVLAVIPFTFNSWVTIFLLHLDLSS